MLTVPIGKFTQNDGSKLVLLSCGAVWVVVVVGESASRTGVDSSRLSRLPIGSERDNDDIDSEPAASKPCCCLLAQSPTEAGDFIAPIVLGAKRRMYL